MKNREATLIKELLALYVKYGADTFEAAVREIRTGETARLIADAADDLHRAVQRTGIRAAGRRPLKLKKTKRDLASERIADMKNTHRSVDIVVAEFAERILNHEILPTSAALREYMAFIGVPMSGRHLDRYDALVSITDHLRNLPELQAKQSIESIRDFNDPVSPLQRWADIIVKPDRN